MHRSLALAAGALAAALPALSPAPPLAAQSPTPARAAGRAVVRDSAPRRRPVTAGVAASAFRDAAARELFHRARRARLAQDSSLASYAATVRTRASAYATLGPLGRERLVYRQESAARVRWKRGVGAHVELTGARAAVPAFGGRRGDGFDPLERMALDASFSPIPYFPGREVLWVGEFSARAEVDERMIVNPLAYGAEAYYTYRLGDSLSIRGARGDPVRLRELEVRPRSPSWNLTAGSLWFDVESGQLVRAAFALAAPKDLAPEPDSSSPSGARLAQHLLAALASSRIHVTAVAIEYALHAGRFWLPRRQTVEGVVEALGVRLPIRAENAFTYAGVNEDLALDPIRVDSTQTEWPVLGRPPDTLDAAARRRWQDSARAVFDTAMRALDDSMDAGLRVRSMRQCDTAAVRVVTEYRYGAARLPVAVRVPCDRGRLIDSPDLPASILDPDEVVFDPEERERMLAEVLRTSGLGSLALGSLPRPRLRAGPSMTRYNRVEGFSTGLAVEQRLGGGYAAIASARMGTADRVPNVELSVTHAALGRTVGFAGYRRLVSAGDRGDPLSFGSSVSAFLFGRDEGFYYRATGAELRWSRARRWRLDVRGFAERQREAAWRATYSVAGAFGPNIAAARGTAAGASARIGRDDGADPRGWRAFGDLRLEAAGGTWTYGRSALDATVTHGLPGDLVVALTAAVGSSAGELPPQRRWHVGGTATVRGHAPDTARGGDAFWLGRLEIARMLGPARVSAFGDAGWAGPRRQFRDGGRPTSGAGLGLSWLDGLIRIDAARGLHPRRGVRVSASLDARF